MENKIMNGNGEIKIKSDSRQSDIIEKILKDLPVTQKELIEKNFEGCVKCGICYMLSMEWLRLIINDDASWKKFGADYETNLAYYKQIMNNHYTYATDAKSLVNVTSFRDIEMDRGMVGLCMKNAASVPREKIANSYNELADVIAGGDIDNRLFFIRLEMGGSAHRVAAYLSSVAKIYFYDPNFGVISVSAFDNAGLKVKAAEFMKRLYDIYAGGNLIIGRAYVRIVQKN